MAGVAGTGVGRPGRESGGEDSGSLGSLLPPGTEGGSQDSSAPFSKSANILNHYNSHSCSEEYIQT